MKPFFLGNLLLASVIDELVETQIFIALYGHETTRLSMYDPKSFLGRKFLNILAQSILHILNAEEWLGIQNKYIKIIVMRIEALILKKKIKRKKR